MASKFQQFLEDNKIDPRRVLVASRQLERLTPEDRRLRLAKRRARGGEGKAEGEAGDQSAQKPRSGRPVTDRLLTEARSGKAITGPAKSRLLRAVNRVLEQKKKDPVDLRALF